MDNNSLAHSKWNCKYHIVFVPKYRILVIYGRLKKEIGEILRLLFKKSRNNRSKGMHRPYTYVIEYTIKVFSGRNNRIFERIK